MPKLRLELVIHVVSLLCIIIFFIAFLNKDYPFVGHDYSYFAPHLLDADMHYRINGLSIQWYTPSWGGGLPGYPNPQHIQFSLPQFITLLLNPWAATILSSIIFMLIGYFAMYCFITRTMMWRWEAGVLGALFFTVNGFYLEHMVVGHLGYQAFPLLPVIALALFSNSLPVIISAIMIAFIFAIAIHEAGFYLFVIFLLSLAVALPTIYLLNEKLFTSKRLLFITLLSPLFFFLLSGSKIFAVYSFMRFFPRTISDIYPITMPQGLLAMIRQYVGVMGLVPLRILRGQDVNALQRYYNIVFKTDYGLWEYDISLSPVLWVFLILGALVYFSSKKRLMFKLSFQRRRWLVGGLCLMVIWMVVEFTLAKGFLYPLLHQLPILSSLHVNVRFASALIFPLAILGAFCSNIAMLQIKSLTKPVVFLLLTILTISPLLSYYSFNVDLWDRWFNINQSLQTYQSIRGGKILPVENIVEINNQYNLIQNSSNLKIYEPVFGYGLGDFNPEVYPGQTNEIVDGYYNITNPASLVFPEENQTRLFERIPYSDASRFQEFVNRRQPDWNRPLIQSILDMIAKISLIVFFIYIMVFLTKRVAVFLIESH
jgi:hypothetical protein